ncbi:MAG: biotin--[acetyl-CoA-carboxylase] ligase, partial [Elusimicrobiota bacterium]
SGEKLAKDLKISRAAVNKQVQLLRKKGYVISAHSNAGYCLEARPDIVSPDEISGFLRSGTDTFQFFYFEDLNSTQEEAKSLAGKSVNEWEVVVAETQRRGKGRLGREWASPSGGIWFSVILKPDILPDSVPQITLVASIALCDTIEKLLGINTSIKWPNDVMSAGMKIAGILTEMSAEVGKTNWVVMGIGINANNDIPADLKESAASLREISGKSINRPELLAFFLEEFRDKVNALIRNGFSAFQDRYNEYSILNGKKVSINNGHETLAGTAGMIDENGYLILQSDNGKIDRIIAGDVTLKNSKQ